MKLLFTKLTLVLGTSLTVAGILQAGPAVAADGLAAAQPQPVLLAVDKRGEQRDPITNQKVKDTSVIAYVDKTYAWLAGIGGLLALIMLIYAGYRYMTSYGDPEKISDAKDIIEKSLIGLALLILAAVILNTINPRTASDPCEGQNRNGCGDINFSKPGG